RALKLWFVLRHYGAEGLRAFIREHVAWAAWLEARLRSSTSLELIAPRSLALLCFRHAGGDEPTQRLIDALHAEGRFFVTPTRVRLAPGGDPRLIIRVSIGATATRFDDVRALAVAIETAATPPQAG
ncbi:MAG: pyridoxal-dependent decarboxylase, partial [Planctomycetota bacterium]